MEEEGEIQFEWPEYLVFSSVLACSVGIGIFYGCFGSKNKTNEEYLLGNRNMHPIPVALSLLCSYVSSITLLGHPVEIYVYGTQIMMLIVSYFPLTWSLAYLYVPFYFNLQITSVYQYMEWRFHWILRIFLSVVNIIYSIFFMSMVVYGPAVALSFVTGINHHLLVAIIFTVCIFYSSLGGIKAVLWTDSLQAVIMLASMAIVVILGISKLGGISNVWETAETHGRINFFNFDPDPRTRHTFWTSLIGGYFTWLPMYVNQAQVQRYIALPSIRAARQALLINLVGLILLMGLCYIAGLVIFATYVNCDPITQYRFFGQTLGVKTPDQLLPKFVMDTLSDYPGLPGLFVAGITCAGLSTVSSVVNSLAASIVEDYVKKFSSNLSESKLAIVSKLVATITGLLGFGFVFIAERMGNIFSAATSMLGILGGPTLGIFLTGMYFPWANTLGAVIGTTISFLFMLFMGIGATIYKNKDGWLPNQALFLDVTNCSNYKLNETWDVIGARPYWKDVPWSPLAQMYSMSDLWYPAVGCILTVALGLFFSLIVSKFMKDSNPPKPSKLFVPLVLKAWLKICPNEMHRLVIFEKDELLAKSDTSSNPSSKDASPSPDIYEKQANGIYNPGFVLDKELESPVEKDQTRL